MNIPLVNRLRGIKSETLQPAEAIFEIDKAIDTVRAELVGMEAFDFGGCPSRDEASSRLYGLMQIRDRLQPYGD